MRAAHSTLVIAAVAAVVACPRAGGAQTIPSPFAFIEERQEAGLFSGYLSAGTGRFGYAPPGGPMFGARYGLELAGPLSLDAAVGLVRGTRDIISPARAEGDRVVGEADVLLTSIDAHLRLSATGARTWHGLSPYILFGGGVVWDVADKPVADVLLDDDEVFDFGVKFLGTAGAGARWFITRRFALRTDITLSLWQIETPVGFGDPAFGFQNLPTKEWVSGLSFTAALLYRW